MARLEAAASDDRRSRAWLRLAVVYFCIAVGLGIAMGATGDHSLFSLHSHTALLGWCAMALFGVIGAIHPSTMRGGVAATQFWIYNLALPVLLVSLGLKLKGFEAVEPVLGLASMAVGLAVLLFAYRVIGALRGPSVANREQRTMARVTR